MLGNHLVSIIVPVFNMEKEVIQCIDSILDQRYGNLQIILVDDGSTDLSSVICEELKNKDTRIETYHLPHSGVSVARNFGLSKAKGTYIQFVDGDDTITKESTFRLVEVMEHEHCDLVVCGFKKLVYHLKIPNDHLEWQGRYSNTQYLCNTTKDPGHHYYGVCWNKLYKASIIKGHHLTFHTNVFLGEDFIFNLDYLVHIKQVNVIADKLYLYNCENEDSLSRTKKKTIKDCKEELEYRKVIFKKYKQVFKTLGLYREMRNQVYQYWFMYYLRNMNYLRKEYSSWSIYDKQLWHNILIHNPDIISCLITVPKTKYYCTKVRIIGRSALVSFVKKILRFM